jgi:hypothetical protein
MAIPIHFRRILPPLHTVVATVFGGWGLWLRNSILSRTFFGNSTGWDSTARFHVWPWPFKFAAVLNMPAFLVGGLLSWFLEVLWPRLHNPLSIVPVLLFVPLLWYRIGSWLDQNSNPDINKNTRKRQWILLLIFTAVCGAASSVPQKFGGYTSYVPLGIAIWVIAVIGMKASGNSRKHNLRVG